MKVKFEMPERLAVLKSRMSIGLATLAALSVLVAAGATQPAAAATRKPHSSSNVVHLTWWTMWSGATLQILNKMITKFNDTHPNIQVKEENIPSVATTSTAKLLSSIAAGDAPDIFTEWWPEIGSFAAKGDLDSMDPYLTGSYKKFEKWEYPVAVQGGTYKNNLYAVPMSLNSWALYYNKDLLSKAGISSPPKSLAQLDADQAKLWVTNGSQVSQLGFYPDTNGNGFQFYTTYFGATNCMSKSGKYDFENCAGAKNEMNWIAGYSKYSYSQVQALQTAEGEVAGGQTDLFTGEKDAFILSGPWEGAQNVPTANPALEGHFGVEPFPAPVGGASTIGQGNFNIVPKGSKHPQQAFEFIAWLAGYNNGNFIGSIDPSGGWIPAGPSVTKVPAFKKWISGSSWLKGFLPAMTSKATQAPVLTPNQSQLFTAEDTATSDVLEKTMTPAQALKYIDKQANS
jgi:multiple sugar transport system substrate-binding protein